MERVSLYSAAIALAFAAAFWLSLRWERRRMRPRFHLAFAVAWIYNRPGVASREFSRPEEGLEWLRRSPAETGASPRTMAIADLETGKAYDLLGQREQALKHYAGAIGSEDVAGSREEARRLLRTGCRSAAGRVRR